MARKKLKSATDQRKFTLVYNDFLESDLLNYYEKMVFITLKKFADNDTMRAFPSLKIIHKITGISLSQVRRSIDHMEELGVISIEHRIDKDKGHQSNIYTLYDYAEIWNVGSSEDVAAVADEVSEMKLVAELRAKGYTVIKEKEPDVEPTKAQQQAINSNQDHDTAEIEISQEERFNLEEVKEMYEYNSLKEEYPFYKNELDAVVVILHDTLNTKKRDIRVGGEYKPSTVVIKRLMCITGSEVIYVIEQFKKKTERISNPRGYILTMLYNAKEQMILDVSNQVSHDMAEWYG